MFSRGLRQKTVVDPKIVDQQTLVDYIVKDFDKENDPKQLAADERLAKLVGVIPHGTSLLDLF